MNVPRLFAPPILYPNRRQFLRGVGNGAGAVALSSLLYREGFAAPANALAPREGHFPVKARSVIWLFMNGGPSHVDTWDYKPELAKRDGQELKGFDKNTGFFVDQVGPIMKSPFKFAQHGQTGTWASDLFPHLSRHVDKMAFLYSCFSDSNNHSPALLKVNTGMARMGFPCLGSWVTYGLGSVSQSLPAFVVMYDTLGRGLPKGYAQNWGSGFLPSVYQGTAFKGQGAPIEDLERRSGMSDDAQRSQLDLYRRLNARQLANNPEDNELSARVESFELAYRMQMAAPEALDVAKESDATRKLYGLDNPKCAHFARQCLYARRLVERGVRFVQIYSGGTENEKSWDGHQNIIANHTGFAAETDQPVAALLADLSARGLLDSTLVVWGGEFGRLPLVQKGGTGRDHNPHAFTTWFAGGGVKAGAHHGQTDEIGHKAVEGKVSINDLHATILALMGLDHEKLTFRYNGRDFRLTDVAGRVVKEIIA